MKASHSKNIIEGVSELMRLGGLTLYSCDKLSKTKHFKIFETGSFMTLEYRLEIYCLHETFRSISINHLLNFI
jgi:hypothetical protein